MLVLFIPSERYEPTFTAIRTRLSNFYRLIIFIKFKRKTLFVFVIKGSLFVFKRTKYLNGSCLFTLYHTILINMVYVRKTFVRIKGYRLHHYFLIVDSKQFRFGHCCSSYLRVL